jgi:hypothetical protein
VEHYKSGNQPDQAELNKKLDRVIGLWYNQVDTTQTQPRAKPKQKIKVVDDYER